MSVTDKQKRQSLISFLWGMKLALFIKELQEIECRDLRGFGKIEKDNFEKIYVGAFEDENLY